MLQLQQMHYVFALSVPSSVPCQIYFFCFARIVHRLWCNLQEVIISTNKLHDYILGEADTRVNSNPCQLVFSWRQTAQWMNSRIHSDWGGCNRNKFTDRLRRMQSQRIHSQTEADAITNKFTHRLRRMQSWTQFHVSLNSSLTNVI